MIAVSIYPKKIIIYDNRNSIAYYRYQAEKYAHFNRFKLQVEAYMDLHKEPTFADVITIAYENKLKAVSYYNEI